ncbi:hypothetical protein BD626DRAFT_486303 [Schizophyllum amplum]|uniref:Uncharacterized protein n=1 Tax=Schizophyllum amplum TaxID=97359 RepID=A0A550CMB7_9AGAR|nr:hypothetical protein BD626DRAFT_486303 [Auriculariopsis ampla]
MFVDCDAISEQKTCRVADCERRQRYARPCPTAAIVFLLSSRSMNFEISRPLSRIRRQAAGGMSWPLLLLTWSGRR